MKIVLQRVENARVEVEDSIVGSIENGYLVFIGVFDSDTEEDAARLAKKVCALRICEDDAGKTNLSLADTGGSLLVVSQFTLCADCSHGNRPSFTGAGKPEHANALYLKFIDECKRYVSTVEHGIFGADMKVSLVNNGPFTIILE